jgi:hypothetical protein
MHHKIMPNTIALYLNHLLDHVLQNQASVTHGSSMGNFKAGSRRYVVRGMIKNIPTKSKYGPKIKREMFYGYLELSPSGSMMSSSHTTSW